ESAAGRGTTITVYLPRAAAPPVAAAVAARAPRATVLLVEDERDVLELAQEILATQGYVVLAAPSPGEAGTIAERHEGPIHLLLTDVVMPRMSGRDLAERLIRMRPDIKVLYMSGYSPSTLGIHGTDAAVALIRKPFTSAELLRRVREVLETPVRA